jgi:hypothetical protein
MENYLVDISPRRSKNPVCAKFIEISKARSQQCIREYLCEMETKVENVLGL